MIIQDYYGSEANEGAVKERYLKIEERLKEKTGKGADAFFSSPGRAEIIGNHTDHNLGKVIVSAITCDIAAAVKKRGDHLIEIYSEGFKPIRFNLTDTKYRFSEKGKSYGLARGVIDGIKKRGYRIGGFTACTHSTVFRGAGVSSSAAFEVLVAEIVNKLFLKDKLTAFDKASIGQYAENVYFGKPCGLLDQTGIALGGMNKVDFKDPKAPVSSKLSAPKGYTIVITNTGGNHSSLTEHYAAIKSEMSSVAELFNKKYLREVDGEEFFDSLKYIKGKVSERALLRAIHFFNENDRVDRAERALNSGDTGEFLSAIEESGESSLYCLQNAFVPGSDTQPIPFALNISKRAIRDGAVRLHGGGFAGTVIAYVSDREAESYIRLMKGLFGEDNVFTAQTRITGAEQVSF